MANEKSFVKNAGDPKQVRDGKVKEQSKRDEELADMRFILSSVEGRRFIWRYLSRCRIFEVSYLGNANDTIFNEGSREIGLRILDEVTHADPRAYMKMVNESNKGTL